MIFVNFKTVMVADDSGNSVLSQVLGALEGRAAATFVVLAGLGISLFAANAPKAAATDPYARVRKTLLKRACFLFVAGTLLTLIWPADILHYYGIYIAIAALVLQASSRRLIGASAAIILLFPALLFFIDYEHGWHWQSLSYSDYWTPAGWLRHTLYNGFHPVIPWLSFLLGGMVLGRVDLLNRRNQLLLLAGSAVVVLGTELLSWLLVNMPAVDAADAEINAALFGTKPMPPVPLYMLSAGGVAVFVIVLMTIFGTRFKEAMWLKPLLYTGQIALTLYVAHFIVGMGFLESIGRLYNQSLEFAALSALAFCLAGSLFATIWRAKYKRAPLEWLMRRLS
ncbi:MAG: DUF418 domain-containing protein [Planctomycetes bacterium]|nr:DUF418 domain-containing protein [Planctomycetota bacterium]